MSRSFKPGARHLKIFVFVSIIVVIVAEFSPSFFGLSGDRRLDEATGLLCNQILLTRQKAIAGNTRYRIHYDVSSGDCRILREEAPGRWVPDGPGRPRCFPDGVNISPAGTNPAGYIEIAATGAVENHGLPLVLELTNRDGDQRSIRISPSGMVQELPNL
jgi:hypothetical protein